MRKMFFGLIRERVPRTRRELLASFAQVALVTLAITGTATSGSGVWTALEAVGAVAGLFGSERVRQQAVGERRQREIEEALLERADDERRRKLERPYPRVI